MDVADLLNEPNVATRHDGVSLWVSRSGIWKLEEEAERRNLGIGEREWRQVIDRRREGW